MSFATVNVHRRGAAATVELNRPDSMNAWNRRFSEDLGAAIAQVAGDAAIRAVCITGAGRAFSSGVDLKDVDAADVLPDGTLDVYKVLTERYHPIIAAIRAMPKPVVAAVNGPAVGIGLSLALAADLVIARESAYFLLAFANIGLVPDGGSSFMVPERIGLARAAEMAMLAERVPAPTALEWGLINRVAADHAFDDEVAALVDRLASGPTVALAGAKRQLNAWLLQRMDEQLQLEAQIQREAAATEDFREGVAAFVERRPAAFRGR